MSFSVNKTTGDTMTPYGELPNNPYLAARIREADKKGLTKARAEAVMQSAGKLSYQEESVIDGLIRGQAKKGASKIGLLTLTNAKNQAVAAREKKTSAQMIPVYALTVLGTIGGTIAGVVGAIAALPAFLVAFGTPIVALAAAAQVDKYGKRS